MNAKIKLAILAFSGIILMNAANAQKPVPLEIISTVSANNNADSNLLQYAFHKKLPEGYEKETLQALSYFPELKNITIRFRIKKSFSTNKTIQKLMPLMFAHLSFEARMGVIGHELSHVVDFSKRNTWQCFRAGIGHLSAHYLDQFEFNTDMICIKHGLGKDLEAWSSYIRNTMHTAFWRGADYAGKANTRHERYMNPSTIEKNINGGINSSTQTSQVK